MKPRNQNQQKMGKHETSFNGGKRAPRSLRNNLSTSNPMIAEDDRLSSLPHHLLVDILSFLPIKSAAANSALSRRWRHLWTKVFCLRIKNLELDTVKHILAQLTSPKIQLLVLEPPRNDWDTVFSLVDSCFNHIRHRNVEEIQVILDPSDLRSIWVPDWVFQCHSLVSLHLHNGLLEVDDHSGLPDSVSLPKLKNLTLWLSLRSPDLAKKLFRSCPLLEHLSLTCYFEYHQFLVDISSPNLKFLSIDTNNWMPSKVVIDAPGLLELTVCDYYHTHYSFVENPTALVKADITFENDKGSHEEDEVELPERVVYNLAMVSSLIRGVSSVAELYLNNCGKTICYLGSLDDEVVPVFNNLTCLNIAPFLNYGCWKDLLFSLRCFPKLEVLDVSYCKNEQELGVHSMLYLPVC